MRPLCVLDVVGLTPAMLQSGDAPALAALAADGFAAPLRPVLPAVTCPVQATLLTGTTPSEHGIVGNGWYFRDLAEVWLWRQSNHLVSGEKVWETARRRDPSVTCAKLFWWYNMHSTADLAVTPRPVYPADGRKLPDLYTQPADLRRTLQDELGTFPLFDFWGPRAGLPATEWIAAAARRVLRDHNPTLALVYLPHLDYDLQRWGPSDPRSRQAVRDVDRIAGELSEAARARGYSLVVLSEYGITPVNAPVHVNRVLRESGHLAVHAPLGRDYLDPGASRAFAVADHQVAHVYVRDAGEVDAVAALLRGTDGVDLVLAGPDRAAAGLDHRNAGEIVAVAAPGRWFSYYYWLDDALAPDFARTVDIHRKPGYDPMELLLDPDRPFVQARAYAKLLAKKLGFRALLDVIGLDASHVAGSHGRLPDDPQHGPVYVSTSRIGEADAIAATAVRDLLLENLFAE